MQNASPRLLLASCGFLRMLTLSKDLCAKTPRRSIGFFSFLTSTLTTDDLSEGTLRRRLNTPPAPRKFNEIRVQELCYQLTEVKNLNRFKRHGCGTGTVCCSSFAFEILGLVTFYRECRDNVKHVNDMLEVMEENKQNMTRTSNDITALIYSCK